jgi:DNA-binding NtrC family response regulator
MSENKVVLVVDDEPDIREAVELALSLEGYTVKGAPDRASALQVISEETPVLILLDYRMPGLKAQDFITQVKERHAETTIVLMTGTRDADEQARELGLEHSLAKPFDLSVLLDLVKQYAV